jgi:tripartite-type tricarboxylate transporter receptor subunit TctC
VGGLAPARRRKKMTRVAITLMSFAVVLGVLLGAAWAGTYPEKEVSIIVNASAGGGTDLTMRALAHATEPILGVPILVVDRPGGGGAIGAAAVARVKPDGYQIGALTNTYYIIPMLRPEVPYRWANFRPIIMVNADPAAIIVREGGRWKTFREFVEYVQQNPTVVTVADCGVGCIWQIAAAALARGANLKYHQVPFDGAAPERIALLGGHVDAMVASIPEVADQVRAKQLRILAVMDDRRDSNFPDVPTLKELGYNVNIGGWRGICGPKDIPDEIVKKLHDAFKKGMEQPTFTDFMKKQGLRIVYRDSEDTAKFSDQERKDFKELLKMLGQLRLED